MEIEDSQNKEGDSSGYEQCFNKKEYCRQFFEMLLEVQTLFVDLPSQIEGLSPQKSTSSNDSSKNSSQQLITQFLEDRLKAAKNRFETIQSDSTRPPILKEWETTVSQLQNMTAFLSDESNLRLLQLLGVIPLKKTKPELDKNTIKSIHDNLATICYITSLWRAGTVNNGFETFYELEPEQAIKALIDSNKSVTDAIYFNKDRFQKGKETKIKDFLKNNISSKENRPSLNKIIEMIDSYPKSSDIRQHSAREIELELKNQKLESKDFATTLVYSCLEDVVLNTPIEQQPLPDLKLIQSSLAEYKSDKKFGIICTVTNETAHLSTENSIICQYEIFIEEYFKDVVHPAIELLRASEATNMNLKEENEKRIVKAIQDKLSAKSMVNDCDFSLEDLVNNDVLGIDFRMKDSNITSNFIYKAIVGLDDPPTTVEFRIEHHNDIIVSATELTDVCSEDSIDNIKHGIVYICWYSKESSKILITVRNGSDVVILCEEETTTAEFEDLAKKFVVFKVGFQDVKEAQELRKLAKQSSNWVNLFHEEDDICMRLLCLIMIAQYEATDDPNKSLRLSSETVNSLLSKNFQESAQSWVSSRRTQRITN